MADIKLDYEQANCAPKSDLTKGQRLSIGDEHDEHDERDEQNPEGRSGTLLVGSKDKTGQTTSGNPILEAPQALPTTFQALQKGRALRQRKSPTQEEEELQHLHLQSAEVSLSKH